MDVRCQRPPKVRERIRRIDFGHLEIEVTVDDPTAYTKPWSVTLRPQFAAQSSSMTAGEKFSKQLK
jgi:hypothetical protein